MSLKRFSVATFNLYNLQLPGKRMNPRQLPWSEAEFTTKLDWIARLLRRLDADIVGFQKLWHAEALGKMLVQSGLDQTYDLLATPAVGTKITCGAIVRKGLLQGQPTWISAFPDDMRRATTSPPLRSSSPT